MKKFRIDTLVLLIALLAIPLVVLAQADTVAPSAPQNLSGIAISSSQINLSWGASLDDTGVQGYKIYRNNLQIATSSTLSYNDTGLPASTSFTYKVAAYDAALNTSTQSASVTLTTLATSVGGGTSGGTTGGTTSGTTGGTSGGTTGGTTPSDTSASAPYQFQRQGIFDCNQNGSYAMSVGALSAIGGVYVPVADSAVELNTGTLVYKECILREVVDRERESAMSAFFKQIYTNIQTGRNGNPMYVQNFGQESLTSAEDPAFLAMLQDQTLQDINPAFKSDVKRSLAQTYEAETRAIQKILTCPIQNDLNALESGQLGSFNFSDFLNESNPACYALGARSRAGTLADSRTGQAMGYLNEQWILGQGFYPRTDNTLDPLQQKILTPSSVVAQSFEQMLQSPVQQLQSANDIGQMIGALYAGVTTQVVGDTKGLSGLAQSVGGQPSYLDQVAKESSQGLQNAAANAALSILTAARQIEASYLQAVNSMGTSLTQTIGQLRGAETQCWNLIIPKVCSSPLSGNNTCTDASGNTLHVATSTAFSQPIINSQITALATTTISNINTSKKALSLISQLITGVTNTSSLDAQRVALQQLDSLVAQHQLHTQTDLQTVSQQLSSIQGAMTALVQTTLQNWTGVGSDTVNPANLPWDGTTSPGIGWCNVNNDQTISAWDQKWKQ